MVHGMEIEQHRMCRNCGHENIEAFCAKCGQENSHHLLPLGQVLSDVISEFISFDSRLYVTIKPLLTRPGFLTNEYLKGKRAAYITPLRLYLMVSAVHFLVFSFYAQPQMQKMFVLSASPTISTPFSARITDSGRLAAKNINAVPDAAATTKAQKRARMMAKLQTRLNEFGRWFSSHLSTLTLFFVPAYAGVLSLLFWRSRRLYMEHLIFILHVHSFELLVSLPALLTPTQFMLWNSVLSLTVAPLYTYFAMRSVYGQGPWKTLAKVLLLTASYLVLAILAGLILGAFFVLR